MPIDIGNLLQVLLQILLGLVGLSLVVLVHEFGHYLAARILGIRVETFSIGFGRRLIGFRRGETDYRISLIPLGGYCRFFGEEAFRKALDEKLPAIPTADGEFYAAEPWKRIIVAVSGPLANMVFAVLVFTVISWVGFTNWDLEPKIVLVSETTSLERQVWPADKAGLQSGDIILSVDGDSVQGFSELGQHFSISPGQEINLTFERNGRQLETTVVPELNKEHGYAQVGFWPWKEPLVSDVLRGSVAEAAGFVQGDIITTINGSPVSHGYQFDHALEEKDGTILEIAILRNGMRRFVSFDTSLLNETSKAGLVFPYEPYIGIQSEDLNFPESLAKGFSETYGVLDSTIQGLKMLFMGIKIQNAVSGPARLISVTGGVALSSFKSGFGPGMRWTFNFLAIISVSLAFFNMIPIPVVDGGQILLFSTEWIRGKAIAPGSVYRYQFIGTIIVLILFVAAITGDVMFFSGR